MITDASIDPKWIKHFDRLMDLTFKFSVILMVMLFFLFIKILMYDDDDDVGGYVSSGQEWCDEYHPKLTYSECADVAGW